MCEVIDKLYCAKKYNEVVIEIEKIKDTIELDDKYKIIYANSLIRSGNHDKALEEIKKLILEGIDNYDINSLILKLIFIGKLDEAEKILLSKEKVNSNDKFLLANIEQRRGNLDKACDMYVDLLDSEDGLDIENFTNIRRNIRMINNNRIYNSFVETEYNSFIKNGNKLEPGHVIYLKKAPEKTSNDSYDEKCSRRPYMIFKIEDDNIYMLPVSTTIKASKDYIIQKKKYPNVGIDRRIKGHVCETTTNNVLYIQDKINETDFNNAIHSVMCSSYLGNSKEELYNMKALFDTFSPEINRNDIIVYMNYDTREKKFYFVIDVKDNNYKTIEIDINEKIAIKDYCVMHDKSKLMLRKFRLSDEENNNIINSIPDSLKLDSLIGKKIEVNNCKYIVVDQNNDTFICIQESYTSHLQINVIKNSNKIKVLEEVTTEELSKIKELFKKHSKSTEKTLKKHK